VWTNSWPSIAGVGCHLVCVGAGEEKARKVYALRGDGETSRLGSRDPVADGIKCGPHGARRVRRSRGHGAGASVAAKSRNEARPSRLFGRQR
jgi:hypothetical protein